MALYHMTRATPEDDANSTAPLVVLFERDDAIAVPLLSQLRLAGYDVRSARTPVELFDILGKHLAAIVLVDLGGATAGRREFWVALDAQRRGRALPVMTFRYTPPGGLFDSDFETSGRAVADVDVRGAHEFQLVVDGVRQRIPLHANFGGVSAPGMMQAGMPFGQGGGIAPIGAALGVPSPFMQAGMGPQAGYGAAANPFAPPAAAYGAPMAPFGHGQFGPASQPQPPYGAPMAQAGYAGAGYAPPSNAYPQYPQPSVSQPSFSQPSYSLPSFSQPDASYGATPPGGYEAASRFAFPASANPYAAQVQEIDTSPFAQPYTMNPFAADTPHGEQPAFAPPAFASPPAFPSSPSTPAAFGASPPPFAASWAMPEQNVMGQRFEPTAFEERAAQLSADYAARFGLDASSAPSGPAYSGIHGGIGASTSMPGFGSQPGARAQGALNGNFGAGLDEWNAPFGSAFSGAGRDAQPPSVANSPSSTFSSSRGGPRSNVPFSDVWTPPDAGDARSLAGDDDLDGATGIVPEMAYLPIGASSANIPGAARPIPAVERFGSFQPQQTPSASWPPVPTPDDRYTVSTAPLDLQAHLQKPQQAPRTTTTEQALSTVLLEGALLTENKIDVLKSIQTMLDGVNKHVKIGELALQFKFLSPDQLLAALLVSRGLVSPEQIAGLGRVKQEMSASGMDYDLETLLGMFNILPAEQLQALRAELTATH